MADALDEARFFVSFCFILFSYCCLGFLFVYFLCLNTDSSIASRPESTIAQVLTSE